MTNDLFNDLYYKNSEISFEKDETITKYTNLIEKK
jgi:hypothetical protein